MKRQGKTTVRLSWLAPLAFILLALQTPSAFGQTQTPGNPTSCVTYAVGGNFAAHYLDPSKGPLCQSAIAAFRSAAVIVIGKTDDQDIMGWLPSIGNQPWKAKYDEGLKFSDAVAFLKARIAIQGAGERAKVIENAFQEVYGRNSSPVEQTTWDAQIRAQQAWYAIIVGELKNNLKSNQTERTQTIQRAYQTSFGRAANATDLQFWLPRTEHYRELVQAQRAWLYSSNGAQDLVGTVTRVLLQKGGGGPQTRVEPEKVKAAIVKYTSGKLIYAEMLKQ